jgi:hypothetical protein
MTKVHIQSMFLSATVAVLSLPGETACLQSCSLATAVSVYTAVAWQWVCMLQSVETYRIKEIVVFVVYTQTENVETCNICRYGKRLYR